MLSWVIDNLHEEVNSVKVKPYNEGIDDKGETDEKLAEEYWKVHKSRNDSIIVNTFHGQTKQTLTCKTCEKSSRKFDYFYTLQMPLPLEEMRLIEIIFHGSKGETPVCYGIRLPKISKISALQKNFSEILDVKSESILFVNIFKNAIYHVYSPNNPLSYISENETVHCFEILGYCGRLMHYARSMPSSSSNTTSSSSNSSTSSSSSSSKNPRKYSYNDESDDDESSSCLASLFGKKPKKKENQEEKENSSKKESNDNPTNQSSTMNYPQENQQQNTPRKDEELNQYVYLHVANRRLEKKENYLIDPNLVFTFGTPLFLSFLSKELLSIEDIYKKVWQNFSRFVKIPQQVAHKFDSSRFPFTLKTVNRFSNVCSSCPWTKFCSGCPLVDLNQIPFHLPIFLAIDWETEFFKECFTPSKFDVNHFLSLLFFLFYFFLFLNFLGNHF